MSQKNDVMCIITVLLNVSSLLNSIGFGEGCYSLHKIVKVITYGET